MGTEILKEVFEDPLIAELAAAGRVCEVNLPAAVFIASFHVHKGKRVLLVVPGRGDLESAVASSAFWVGEGAVFSYPPVDILDRETASDGWEERVRTANALARGKPGLYVWDANSVLLKLPRLELVSDTVEVRVGEKLSPQRLCEKLARMGYERVDRVISPGEFSKRGDIVDVFAPGSALPIRLEFEWDRLSSLREFDPTSQRTMRHVRLAEIIPAQLPIPPWAESFIRERLKKQLQALSPASAAILSSTVEMDIEAIIGNKNFTGRPYYSLSLMGESISPEAFDLIYVYNPEGVEAEIRESFFRLESEFNELVEKGEIMDLGTKPYVHPNEVRPLLGKAVKLFPFYHPNSMSMRSEAVPQFQGMWKAFVKDVERFSGRTVVVTTNPRRVVELLAEDGPRGRVTVVRGNLPTGFRIGRARISFVTDAELWGTRSRMEKPRRTGGVKPEDLKPGEIVVHEVHGIGIFRGFTTETIDGVEKEFAVIEYAYGEKLYVSVENLHRVHKYRADVDGPPKLSRLGGPEWRRTRARVRRSVENVAKELFELYLARAKAKGYRFSPDTDWQKSFEDAFPYELTEDQRKAIEDVKRDMESEKPMDRLVCGDVGFGKTEVAMRAAFKAIMDSKQVAVLVPTTVLADQHYRTFKERFAPYPVRVEVLTRFVPERRQKQILKDLREGKVDIIIGTHRLLGKDVKFKDLGLVIVDEEHKFGVKHKEALKKLKVNVDVLTLTATPIPRTLYMAISGIKDMSLIQTPPSGRKPVRVFVMEHSDEIVREAILRELRRGGQVFYVHNRVEDIERAAEYVKSLVPEARIGIAHGKMGGHQLEGVMHLFMDRKIDVLVCTTIIESGLDLPNVNTVIVENAHRFGLAQLYQIKGRVGRRTERAYAYLLYPKDALLSPQARKRLEALREFAELGAGLSIALKDLEIRGAGEIFGKAQHGHIAAVGLDLYIRLLRKAVEEMISGRVEDREPPAISIPLDVRIPDWYVGSQAEKIELYRRIGETKDIEDLRELEEEIRDRFGKPPKSVENLLGIAAVRILGERAGVRSVTWERGNLKIALNSNTPLNKIAFWEYLLKRCPTLKAIISDGEISTKTSREDAVPTALSLIEAVLSATDKSQAPASVA